MAKSKKRNEVDIEAVAKAVEKQLPGWRLARQQEPAADGSTGIPAGKAVRGVSMDDLRKKYLPSDEASDARARGASEADAPSDGRESVLLEPSDGGPSKVADFDEDGELRIVQG